MAGALKPVVFTRHALERIALRGIAPELVVSVLRNPLWTAPDPRPGVVRAFGYMAEDSTRMLRVAFVEAEPHIRVLSAHPDRSARPPDVS